MALTATWNSNDTWSQWASASTSPRIYNGAIKLPFNQIIGFSNTRSVKALWEIGNSQGLNDSSGVIPITPLLQTIGNPITQTQIVEEGLLSPTRNGYVFANPAKLAYPSAQNVYIGVWFKSNIADYSQGKGYVLIYSIGLNNGQQGYAIFIDTDNRIKAAVRESGSTTILNPIGGDVIIDTNWHIAVLIPGVTGSTTLAGLFVDNQRGSKTNISPQTTGGSPTFAIGSNSYDSFYGFSGIMDEPIISEFTGTADWNTSLYRFSPNTFVSPVVDTGKNGSTILEIEADYEVPNNSSIVFYFRASDTSFSQFGTTPDWSPGIPHYQVSNQSRVNLKNLGIFQAGRYCQVKVVLTPSDDNLKTSTPLINSLSINCGVRNQLLASSLDALIKGSSLIQIVNFSGTQKIDKVALDLTVIHNERKEFFIGNNGTVSFSAANFQFAEKAWVFQQVNHVGLWQSSSISIGPTFRDVNYPDNPPYLQYKLYIDEEGEYEMWGYGYTDPKTLYWSWDFDSHDLREVTLANSGPLAPQWTKFGTIRVEQGGIYTFTVYLGEPGNLILDQWYFTNKSTSGFATNSPWALSLGPFTTAAKIQSISNNQPNGNNKIVAWLPSTEVNASGRFNYLIMSNSQSYGQNYTNGLALEFLQIGGDENFFAAWDFAFIPDETSLGDAYIALEYGQSSVSLPRVPPRPIPPGTPPGTVPGEIAVPGVPAEGHDVAA